MSKRKSALIGSLNSIFKADKHSKTLAKVWEGFCSDFGEIQSILDVMFEHHLVDGFSAVQNSKIVNLQNHQILELLNLLRAVRPYINDYPDIKHLDKVLKKCAGFTEKRLKRMYDFEMKSRTEHLERQRKITHNKYKAYLKLIK